MHPKSKYPKECLTVKLLGYVLFPPTTINDELEPKNPKHRGFGKLSRFPEAVDNPDFTCRREEG
jgi:hypothetical protein